MEYEKERVDEMDRLHDKGYIGNPRTKKKSVTLTEQGELLSKDLFKKHFGLTSKSQRQT